MRYVRPREVAWVLVEEMDPPTLFVTHLPNGMPRALEGSAAEVWLTAVELEEREAVMDALATAYGLDRALIESEADGFLDELVRLGLLSRSEP